MRYFKKFVAIIIVLCMILGSNETIIFAQAIDDVQKETQSESISTDTDADADADIHTYVATESDAEQALDLNYIVVESDYVQTPDTQYVLADLNYGGDKLDEAYLTYINQTTGITYEKSADIISGTSLVFNINFTDDEYTGVYKLLSIRCVESGKEYSLDFASIDIDSVFGVNTVVDAQPDAWIVDSENDTENVDAGVTVTDIASGQTIQSDDIAAAMSEVIDNSDEELMKKSSDGNLVVVLDAGHSGSDCGTLNTINGVTYYERDINLKIANYCKAELEKYLGVTVYMTRTDNTTEWSIVGRVNKAKEYGADVLVSLHVNSAGPSAKGALVLIPSTNYNAAIGNEADGLGKEILSKLSALGLENKGNVIRIFENGEADNPSQENYPDGSKADYYGICRYSKREGFPGIIIEHAFLSNPTEAAKYLTSDAMLKELGIADATAIANYYGLISDYSAVYDYDYYINKYPDLKNVYGNDKNAAFEHFIKYGMAEGRQANATFDVIAYKNRYSDLRNLYGNNLKDYYAHYIKYGQKEGRIATGDNIPIQNPTTVYNGVDYSAVYDFNYYIEHYNDIKQLYEYDDKAAIQHFVKYGMAEGRQAKDNFNVFSYKNRYADLRIAYGNDIESYYMHYIKYGKNEGRIANGDITIQNPITVYNGIDYSLVYNFNYYINRYSDLKAIYANDDVSAIEHFVKYGMKEGRQAKASFDPQSYRNAYTDLRQVYRFDWEKYYIHYIQYGKKENRCAIGVNALVNPVTTYNGTDYSDVYDFNDYITIHPDINALYINDDIGAIEHFVKYGMKEGRQAKNSFSPQSYRNTYIDLRYLYDMNWEDYYIHYMTYGKKEGRIAAGINKFIDTATVYDGIDYSAVYDFNQYIAIHPDIKTLYENDDIKALEHFVKYGMSEGRIAKFSFIVQYYKDNYTDLSSLYGNDWKQYYIHYIKYGVYEKRIADKRNYTNIMGDSETTLNQMVAYYNANASYPMFYQTSDAPTIEDFCRIYLEECSAEGVRAEVAFCQAMKETGFLKFGGNVKIEQYNFAGLGATGGGVSGASFASVRLGIRAQVQHLKAYASTDNLNYECVDSRFDFVSRGVAPYVEWLGINENPSKKGWATAVNYGYSIINNYITKLYMY